jgi:hypothetical protein
MAPVQVITTPASGPNNIPFIAAGISAGMGSRATPVMSTTASGYPQTPRPWTQ